jgi:hypothetical protein
MGIIEYNKDLMKSMSMGMFDSGINSFGTFNDFEKDGITITIYGNGSNKEGEKQIKLLIKSDYKEELDFKDLGRMKSS